MPYITKSDLENYLGVSISSTASIIVDSLISGSVNYIEKYCGGKYFSKRKFAVDIAEGESEQDKTMYYDGNGYTMLAIDDVRSVSAVELNGNALVEGQDYYLYPLNAAGNDEPYEWIELIQPETRIITNSRVSDSSSFIFDAGQRNVKIAGKFGYSVVPPAAIKLAALKIAGAVLKENVGDSNLKEISSESIGEYSVSYTKISEVANKTGVNDILNSFVRKGIPKRNKDVKID